MPKFPELDDAIVLTICWPGSPVSMAHNDAVPENGTTTLRCAVLCQLKWAFCRESNRQLVGLEGQEKVNRLARRVAWAVAETDIL
ncbi:unnamed protein product [Protopolystoma xenopodis]|uniref:Uncharacterized protein n=1 Tax=Protopolystoma xenopodis TaxID=117903 RepID=A0A3S4ZV91_9PLAT|nr:unnamed protein product [Protopolystoma xenopodis]